MEGGGMAMNTELVCVMASLGYSDGEEYLRGVDCLAGLKDLIRFLRRDDDTCTIRRQMGYAQVLQNDLLPILVHHGDDEELVEIVVRLLVNLTSPAEICFERQNAEVEESGAGKTKVTNQTNAYTMEVIGYLQAYKEAFVNKKVMAGIGAQLAKILQMDWDDRSEEHLLFFERLLLLIRNVVHVPASPEDEQRTEDDVSLHDQVLWNMHLNGIDDLLIYITASADEARWAMHSIETISLMLREQNPEKLARTAEGRTKTEKVADSESLKLARERDQQVKRESAKKFSSSRHSRFGGSFWVNNMKGIDNKNTLVRHKIVKDAKQISFDEKKFRARKAKNKQSAKEMNLERSSTLSIRLFLKEFCVKFLEHCYNPLMKLIKDNVTAHKSQENDETYYIWSMRFFMMFNRSYQFKADYVRQTLHMTTFHYVIRQIQNYYDHFLMNKRSGWEPWQKRLHLSLQAYKELLMYVSCMDRSNDQVLKDGAAVIKNNVFYHEEYRDIFILLLKHYNEHKQTRTYLIDLVETFHVFLKLLEGFVTTKGSLLVQKKSKVSKRKKKKKKNSEANTMDEPIQLTSEEIEEVWEEDLAPSLSALLQGHEDLPDDVASPFDPTLEMTDDQQRLRALLKVQKHLRRREAGCALALLRMAREVWPEESMLGGAEPQNAEEEFGVVRNLLLAEIERPAELEVEDEEGEMEEEEAEEEEIAEVHHTEREFNLKHFLSTLASPHIVRPFCLLLRTYKQNTLHTNHAIAKLLHRIAIDLNVPEMLFQVSLFQSFQDILSEPRSKLNKELSTFARHVVSKFIRNARNKPTIYIEALFWKTGADCFKINERPADVVADMPGCAPKKGGAAVKTNWSFEDEEELTALFNLYRDSEAMITNILKNISNKERTPQQIHNKLVRLKLVDKRRVKYAHEWTPENTEELSRLFDEFQHSDHPIQNIMNAITFNKTKPLVVKKLVEMGKVADRKELNKKPQRRRKDHEADDDMEGGNMNEAQEGSGSDGEDDGPFADDFVESSSDDDNHTDEVSSRHTDSSASSSSSDLLPLISEVRKGDFLEQVGWVQSRLRRAAESREEEEEDEWYAIPLLSMSEQDDSALQDPSFQRMLRKMGLKPPANEQEAFWRIPESISAERLKRFAEELEGTTDEPSLVDATDEPSSVDATDEPSSADATEQQQGSLDVAIESDDSGEEKTGAVEPSDEQQKEKRKTKKNKKKRESNNGKDIKKKKKKGKKKGNEILMDMLRSPNGSDAASDDERTNNEQLVEPTSVNRPIKSSETGYEPMRSPAQKRSLPSDDESEEVTEKKSKKSRAVFDDSDEDDELQDNLASEAIVDDSVPIATLLSKKSRRPQLNSDSDDNDAPLVPRKSTNPVPVLESHDPVVPSTESDKENVPRKLSSTSSANQSSAFESHGSITDDSYEKDKLDGMFLDESFSRET